MPALLLRRIGSCLHAQPHREQGNAALPRVSWAFCLIVTDPPSGRRQYRFHGCGARSDLLCTAGTQRTVRPEAGLRYVPIAGCQFRPQRGASGRLTRHGTASARKALISAATNSRSAGAMLVNSCCKTQGRRTKTPRIAVSGITCPLTTARDAARSDGL